VREPGLEAELPKNFVNLAFLEIDRQVVGPVAGALLVANRLAEKLVTIAE
jgi:hypothetical protein